MLLAAACIPAGLKTRLARSTQGLEPPLYLAPADVPGVKDAIASFEEHQDLFSRIITRRWMARRVRYVELAVEYREKQDSWVAYAKGGFHDERRVCTRAVGVLVHLCVAAVFPCWFVVWCLFSCQ